MDSERPAPPRLPRSARLALAIGCWLLSLWVAPRWLCGRRAGALFDGDLAAQEDLGRRVAASALAQRPGTVYHTKEIRFDGQSAIAVHQMTILALGQIVLAHPEQRDAYLPAIRAAADRLADPATLRYAAQRYGHHAVDHMDPGEGHAYAGYINMGLGMARLVDPDSPHARLNDRLSEQLRTRLFRSTTGLIDTYPGESWPPDVAVVAGSIGLHARATGLDLRADLDAWAERFARCAVDPSGYLIQRVRAGGCQPVDAPRGSGTALASYAIGFAHPGLSRRLEEAIARDGLVTVAGFGGIREYAAGSHGKGDTNSGPLFLGTSVGATGFGLGAARMNGDRALYEKLYRSSHLFGIPVSTGQGESFALGGVLGNALLLAMLTAKAP
jgi:hypothetical protein